MASLDMIGVTGTNGKTTTTFIIKHFLEFLGVKCGLIGTVKWVTGEKEYVPTHTTPGREKLRELCGEMVESGVKAVAMEVSSHALVQKRVEGIEFQTAVFTNLTQDHLDYHGSMEKYAEAKARLFEGLGEGASAVVNREDEGWKRMVKGCRGRVVTYGRRGEVGVSGVKGRRFWVEVGGKRERFETEMVGRFNVMNVLAAVGVGWVRGFGLQEMGEALRSFGGVPGRMERVGNGRGVEVFVDYAHTPDALERVLGVVRGRGRVIVVYGCGGDRDQGKRAVMGRVAECGADVPILTSDNPRSEDPEKIVREVLMGCTGKTVVEVDRRKAIGMAVGMARRGDVVVIAGKGHETKQIFSGEVVHFDDRDVAREFLI